MAFVRRLLFAVALTGTLTTATWAWQGSVWPDMDRLASRHQFDPADEDGDGISDVFDNCPATRNPQQSDSDSDGEGDACDACPLDPANDVDKDEICGDDDNCPSVASASARC